MNKSLLSFLLLSAPFTPPVAPIIAAAVLEAPLGGPPAIRLAGRSGGDLNAAQWRALKAVDLVGCMPDARIVSLTFCIKDCKGKDAMAGGEGATLTLYQRQMIANLPPGTPFRVQVVVRDRKGRAWDIPEAHFIWRG